MPTLCDRWVALARYGGLLVLLLSALPSAGQFHLTEVNFECPCSVVSSDGTTAEVSFGIVNNSDFQFDDLHVTLAIAGERKDSLGNVMNYTAFLDTVELGLSVEPNETLDMQKVSIELGATERGAYYFELLLHSGPTVERFSMRDSVWLRDEHEAPFEALNLSDANYLIDSDGDGVVDLNEIHVGTDPDDPTSTPDTPVIDVLVVYDEPSFDNYFLTAEQFIGHVFAATSDMYERSESPAQFRAVGTLSTEVDPDLSEGQQIEESKYLELIDEYGADMLVVFRPVDSSLCGFAVQIGGDADKGFLHPNERFPYTEVFLDPSFCALDVTAHEIGHLMGLGHSFRQGSTGSFAWSRGHGVEGEFGTIMTYSRSYYRGTGIDVFSNPEVDCHGHPCGVSHTKHNSEGSSNAALSLNVTKYQFAATHAPDDSLDVDGDGYGAVSDAFPLDPKEWSDTDGDGFGDNQDVFVSDPLEWADADGDGLGNNSDPDIDNDGVPNHLDSNPFDADAIAPKLIQIRSDEKEDQFGFDSVRVSDLDGDGLRDLAISAPGSSSGEQASAGKIYLLSLSELIQPEGVTTLKDGSKQLTSLLDSSSSWVISGSAPSERIGTKLVHIAHPNDSSELVIFSRLNFYLLNLDIAVLNELDESDGTADHQINVGHCQSVSGCTKIGVGREFFVHSVFYVADLNADGMREVVLLIGDYDRPDQVSFIVLDRADIVNASNDVTLSPTINEILQHGSSSYRLTTSGNAIFGEIDIRNPDAAEDEQEVIFGVRSRQGGVKGKVYVLHTSQLKRLNELDSEGARELRLNNLLDATQRTYRIRSNNDFGYQVNPMKNLGSKNEDGLFVWGRDHQHYVMLDSAYRLVDFNDGSVDGKANLQSQPHTDFGIWLFQDIHAGPRQSSSVVFPSVNQTMPNQLLTPYASTLFYAEIWDPSFLDSPREDSLDGRVDLPRRIRFPGIYALRAPFGPKGENLFSGVSSLGDLDDDNRQDFVFCMQSGDLEGSFSSCFVIFTSEFDSLDVADGVRDHFVVLNSPTFDLDGDGLSNLQDDDDDGDGLKDTFDVYPHLAQFQHDADRDGYANPLDAYPLDGREHADLDGDGIGDIDDNDRDGDGIPNDEDTYPDDSDNDGIRNEDDPDDDNDTVPDEEDAFPLDPEESLDTDGDGVGDNSDAFAMDPTEWLDTDSDGIGNNADADDDNDGYDDEVDVFPLIASEWQDTDGDGVGDNADLFPLSPLEWEDLDGDGHGDNLDGATLTTYKLSSDWFSSRDIPFFWSVPALYRLGDINRDGKDDLELTFTTPHVKGRPTIFLSGADLESLDLVDGLVEYEVSLEAVHHGDSSLQVVDESVASNVFRHSLGAVADLNSDGSADVIIFEGSARERAGWFTILYGGDWDNTDGADGHIDGRVDLRSCLDDGSCVRVINPKAEQWFGVHGSLIANINNSSSISVAISAAVSESREFSIEGSPTVYLVDHKDIAEVASTSEDSRIDLKEITDQANTWIFYPEYEGLNYEDSFSYVTRAPDIDQDGIHDLLVSYPLRPEPLIYVLASSELGQMDAADSTADREIDLTHSYTQPHSFRLDGYTISASFNDSLSPDELNNPQRLSYHLPVYNEDRASDVQLIDLRELAAIDRAEEFTDGIIEAVPTGSHNSWNIESAGWLKICLQDDDRERRQALASIERPDGFNQLGGQLEFISFDMADLGAIDASDGRKDGVISYYALLNNDVASTWQISLGSISSRIAYADFNCAGDIDGDGSEDAFLVLEEYDEENDRARVLVYLLTFADFPVLDRLDGAEDRHITFDNPLTLFH